MRDFRLYRYCLKSNNMNTNQIFQYNGSPITFHKGDNVMVNATEMAKPFGKSPKDFFENRANEDVCQSIKRGEKNPLV